MQVKEENCLRIATGEEMMFVPVVKKALAILVGGIICLQCCGTEHELPVFGRRNVQNPLELASIQERLKEYWHPCITRQPKREAPNSEIQRWKKNRIKHSDLKLDLLVGKGHAKYYLSYLQELEELLAQVSAECYRYTIPDNAMASLSDINSFYDTNNYWYWEGVHRNTKRSVKWFVSKFRLILERLNERLDVLDEIHKEEHERWATSHPEEYAARKRAKEQRIALERAALMAEAANARASAAEKKAFSAEKRAKEAEERAASAEAAATSAEAAAADAINAAREAVRRTSY